ncbi:MAG: phosphohistidine phosphatase SixA [Deltaproteobacteria bacterium]|nr:MAG: phosphohistidine phosphatase SixA [Deltaproteobacteria bacterium]
MIDLWIIRHSIAGHDAPTDQERRLTREGTDRAVRLAQRLERVGVRFECILHSPLQRAVETAILLERVARRREETFLLACSPSEKLLEKIRAGGASVALVGHMPGVSELASWLSSGERETVRFDFQPATAAWLKGEPSPGRMWVAGVLPPAWYE